MSFAAVVSHVVSFLVLSLAVTLQVLSQAPPASSSVIELAGDGVADDTGAIQAALDRAAKGPKGSAVRLPPGAFRVTRPLVVENCLLSGLEAGGWPADKGPLPTLIVDHTEGPAVIAKDAASVHGLSFEYDHKGEAARRFGPAVRLSGNGISISNLRIHQPYEGIMADGIANIGRLNIENVFIVSARKCGIYVTHTLDIPTIRNVEVWNPNPYCLQNAVGFRFGHNDEIRLTDCFAFSCKTGFLFEQGKTGRTWGGMTGCSTDFCAEGVVIRAAHKLRIVGGCLWSHHTSLRLDGPGRVVVTGTDLQANGDSALRVLRTDGLTMSGCNLGKSGPDWPSVPAVKIEGGDSVSISGCTFDANGPGVVLLPGARLIAITNSVFQSDRFAAIVDRSGPKTRKRISGNLSAGGLRADRL